MDELSLTLDDIPFVAENALVQIIASEDGATKEAVIVLPDKGEIKVLNEVGSVILELINGERSIQEITAAVIREYDVPSDRAEADILTFLNQLRSKQLIFIRNRNLEA